MAHTNRGRVIMGGLLAGTVINVVSLVSLRASNHREVCLQRASVLRNSPVSTQTRVSSRLVDNPEVETRGF